MWERRREKVNSFNFDISNMTPPHQIRAEHLSWFHCPRLTIHVTLSSLSGRRFCRFCRLESIPLLMWLIFSRIQKTSAQLRSSSCSCLFLVWFSNWISRKIGFYLYSSIQGAAFFRMYSNANIRFEYTFQNMFFDYIWVRIPENFRHFESFEYWKSGWE